jgi:plastocyanin
MPGQEQQRHGAAVERARRGRGALEGERTVEQRRELARRELGAVQEVQARKCTVAPGLLHRLMRLAFAPLAGAVALGIGACGGDDGGSEPPAASGECPGDAVVIRMVDIQFDPREATARAGQEICWPNEDEIEHNAVAESGATFESKLYGKGETFTTTVEEPGRVEYVCTIHPGMTGSIEVKAAAGGGGY